MPCSVQTIADSMPARSNKLPRVLLFGALVVASLTFVACGEDPADSDGGEAIEHVHGLGINPADGALFIATHSGLFRSAEGSELAERVGTSTQDTMGFTVVGPDRFLGSGHPGPGEEGPSNLGLIESIDGGGTWSGVSLPGEADFHVLRYAQNTVYGFNGLTGLIMVSADEGETWTEREPPAPVFDLAVDPDDPDRVFITTERGLASSDDAGKRWRPVPGDIGLLAWGETDRLYLVNGAGEIQVSDDGGRTWTDRGSIGGQPGAFVAGPDGDLYAALVDGTVLGSTDGGASWSIRSAQG
jgi:hypothetical protein